VSSKPVLCASYQIMCKPQLDAAILLAPVILTLSSSASKLKVMSKPVVLEGDIAKVKMPSPYMAGAFVIPGALLVQADAEKPEQLSKKLKVENKAVLLQAPVPVAGKATAPAMQPNPPGPPKPDDHSEYKAPQIGEALPAPLKLKTV
jgi:hypothetical protein